MGALTAAYAVFTVSFILASRVVFFGMGNVSEWFYWVCALVLVVGLSFPYWLAKIDFKEEILSRWDWENDYANNKPKVIIYWYVLFALVVPPAHIFYESSLEWSIFYSPLFFYLIMLGTRGALAMHLRIKKNINFFQGVDDTAWLTEKLAADMLLYRAEKTAIELRIAELESKEQKRLN